VRSRKKSVPPPFDIYQSAVGKKWVMAITGVMLIGFVVAHLIGNLKLYLNAEEINLYGESLRDLGGHLVPRTSVLWLMRLGLIAAFALHIHSAYSLRQMSVSSNGAKYQTKQDWLAADWASRTMRWTGPIIALYLVFHLADLTWGVAVASDWERGDPYNNLVNSMQRPLVAILYVIANIALAIHLFHGTWSLFQSLGLNNPRFNVWRKRLASGLAGLILIGNLSFPLAVQLGLVENDNCARAEVIDHNGGDASEAGCTDEEANEGEE
jgi:succinate dehydrogenase / fumarate reductase cytochrome b subunit